MHGLEWVFSVVLAAVFLLTGINRAFRYEKARDLFPWVKDVPRTLVQVIGIAEHEIEAVGESVPEVALSLLDAIAEDGEMLTLLKGEDLAQEALDGIVASVEKAHPELEIETHDGGQPLYPLIMAVE